MSDQLSLPGMPSQSQEIHRLFLALFPDANAASHITQLSQELRTKHDLRGKPRSVDHLHLTLLFLKEHPIVPESVVQAARMAATKVAASTSPFDVTFDRVKSFTNKPTNRPCVLLDDGSNASLREFHRELVAAFRKAERFTPHITLLYDNKIVAEERVTPVRWTVNEFVLVHSCQGNYESLGRWTLQG
jgi:2'-5' RNA ligase